MALIDFLIVGGIFLMMFVLAYCKVTGRSLGDLITEVKDAMMNPVEQVDIR